MTPLIPLLIATTTIAPERLESLEQSLEAPKLHAQIWWYGWLAVYAGGAIVQGMRLAFLVDPRDEDAASRRADLAVSAIKATAGVITMLARPLQAMYGAEPMRRARTDAAKLAAGEAALMKQAEESERRLWWFRHLMVVGVNIIGGLIIWLGYDDLQRAVINAGVGIAVGELAIWTQPWQPPDNYREYQAQAERSVARSGEAAK